MAREKKRSAKLEKTVKAALLPPDSGSTAGRIHI